MTMGHHQLDTVDGITKDTGHLITNHIAVAISGHHVKPDMGIIFTDGLGIFVQVAQVDHMLGLQPVDAHPHKPQAGMGIRHYQDLH
jgi:hypothetical protein